MKIRVRTRRPLMPHQIKALNYCLTREHPALFMEMRLGKTLVAIRWVRKLGLRTCVVVAPLTVMETWERELAEEGEVAVRAYGRNFEQKAAAMQEVFDTPEGERKWLLINYEGLLAMGEVVKTWKDIGGVPTVVKRTRKAPLIARLPWDAVILDESTKIRNPQAQITQICCDDFRRVAHRCILSGLPTPEGELDIFQQLKFLHGRFMDCKTWWQFRSNHFVPDFEGNWEPGRGKRILIKRAVHGKAYVLRRGQAGIGSKKIYEQLHVDMTPEQVKLYREIERDFAVTLGSGEKVETENVLTQMTWMARIAGGCDIEGKPISDKKTKAVVDLLKGELAHTKAVIWFRFRSEGEMMHQTLEKAKIPHVVIVGGMKQEDRARILRSFRETGYIQCLLATEKVAKFGVDCSAADAAIYYSNEYACEDRVQSEDRIVHPQKQRPLLYVDVVTRGTIDEDAVEIVRGKSLDARAFMTKFIDTVLKKKAA